MPALGLPRNENIATEKSEWETPPALFGYLDGIYHFQYDMAASLTNALCTRYYAKDGTLHTDTKDGLDYHCMGDLLDPCVTPKDTTCFMNPDYSRGIIDKMMQQALIFSEAYNNVVVCLVPFCAHGWFKRYAMAASEIQMIGRVKYVGYYKDGSRIDQSPSYDSCIVIFVPGNHNHTLTVYQGDK